MNIIKLWCINIETSMLLDGNRDKQILQDFDEFERKKNELREFMRKTYV